VVAGFILVAVATIVPTDQDTWLTRDQMEGVLSLEVEVWAVRPESRTFPDGDVMWLAPMDLVDRKATRLGSLTVAEAKKLVGNGAPETARECTLVGRGKRT